MNSHLPLNKSDFQMSFKGIRILSLNFSTNPNFNKSGKISMNMDMTINHSVEEGNVLALSMNISLGGNEFPFSLDIESEGKFSFKEIPEEKLLNNLANINCPAIMFPYLRETIADITRRAGFPPLHLQPINFINLNKKSNPTTHIDMIKNNN